MRDRARALRPPSDNGLHHSTTCDRGITTSQPFCCSTRAVAALVSGNIASATQPVNNATRARWGPTAGRTSGNGPRNPLSLGSIACIRRRVGGSNLVRPTRSAQSIIPKLCSSRAGANAILTLLE